MYRRVISICLVLVICIGSIGLCGSRVHAASDSLDEIGWKIREGIEGGSSQVVFRTTRSDIENLLSNLFARYPVLHHYYGGCSWVSYPDYTDVTFTTKNLQDDFDDIWVVDSDEDLLAVLGLGLAELRESIDFVTANGYQVTTENTEWVFRKLQHECHLAYMGYFSWGLLYTEDQQSRVIDYEFTYEYFYDLDTATIRQWRADAEYVAKNLATTLFAQDMPDYMKLLLIHDWLVENSRYNITNMDEVGNHMAYGPMVKGLSVCMGYAEAANLLLQAAGIETQYVSGYGTNSDGHTEAHAWNAVKIGGEWYMMDITWDDPVTYDGSDVLRYDYFNVTSDQLAKDHQWDYNSAPWCNGTFYNAERVLELVRNDSLVYTQYSDSRLVTVAEATQNFRDAVNSIPQLLPEKPYVPETEPTTPPTEPTKPVVKPQNQTGNQTGNNTNNTTATKPTNQDKNSNFGTVVFVVILVAAGGAAAFFLLKMNSRSSARSAIRTTTSNTSGNHTASSGSAARRTGTYTTTSGVTARRDTTRTTTSTTGTGRTATFSDPTASRSRRTTGTSSYTSSATGGSTTRRSSSYRTDGTTTSGISTRRPTGRR